MPNLQEAFINALINSAGPIGAVRGLTQPPVDLGRISVQAPPSIPQTSVQQQQPQISQLTPDQIMQRQQREDFVSAKGKEKPQKNQLMQFLKAVAPQLIAAGVGTAFPQTLAGAAGFSTGLTEEQTRQKTAQNAIDVNKTESAQLEDVYIMQDGQLVKVGQVPKSARIASQKDDTDFSNLFSQVTGKETGTGVKQAQEKTKEINEKAAFFSQSTGKYYDKDGNEL